MELPEAIQGVDKDTGESTMAAGYTDMGRTDVTEGWELTVDEEIGAPIGAGVVRSADWGCGGGYEEYGCGG